MEINKASSYLLIAYLALSFLYHYQSSLWTGNSLISFWAAYVMDHNGIRYDDSHFVLDSCSSPFQLKLHEIFIFDENVVSVLLSWLYSGLKAYPSGQDVFAESSILCPSTLLCWKLAWSSLKFWIRELCFLSDSRKSYQSAPLYLEILDLNE